MKSKKSIFRNLKILFSSKTIFLIMFLLLINFVSAQTEDDIRAQVKELVDICGDNVCDSTENTATCPTDCVVDVLDTSGKWLLLALAGWIIYSKYRKK